MDGRANRVFKFFQGIVVGDGAYPINVILDGRLHFPWLVLFLTAKRRWKLVPVDSNKEMEDVSPYKIPVSKSDTSF